MILLKNIITKNKCIYYYSFNNNQNNTIYKHGVPIYNEIVTNSLVIPENNEIVINSLVIPENTEMLTNSSVTSENNQMIINSSTTQENNIDFIIKYGLYFSS